MPSLRQCLEVKGPAGCFGRLAAAAFSAVGGIGPILTSSCPFMRLLSSTKWPYEGLKGRGPHRTGAGADVLPAPVQCHRPKDLAVRRAARARAGYARKIRPLRGAARDRVNSAGYSLFYRPVKRKPWRPSRRPQCLARTGIFRHDAPYVPEGIPGGRVTDPGLSTSVCPGVPNHRPQRFPRFLTLELAESLRRIRVLFASLYPKTWRMSARQLSRRAR
jgi:hypothetical protein